MTRAAIALLAGLLGACAMPVAVEPVAAGSEVRVRRIALLPLTVRLRVAGPELGGERAQSVSRLVTGQVLEALSLGTAYDVIPPEEVSLVLAAAGPDLSMSLPENVGETLRASFGIDAVLHGNVRRFRERVGGQRGATQPAGVLLELELRSPEGAPLWRGTYDEIQRPLSDDVRSFSLALGRRFRWLTVRELSRDGVAALIARLPEAAD